MCLLSSFCNCMKWCCWEPVAFVEKEPSKKRSWVLLPPWDGPETALKPLATRTRRPLPSACGKLPRNDPSQKARAHKTHSSGNFPP